MGARAVRLLGIAIAITACAPRVDGPVERQRAADHVDGDRLAQQLAALPGAVSAHVTLHRAVADPLTTTPPVPSSAGVLLVVDDEADRAAVARAATALVRAAAPEITSPEVIVEVGAHRPALATVGPFTVEERSRGPLRAALAIALAAIAGLAAWIAVRERQRLAR